MALGYIAQQKDYWIAANAVTITLNALGDANRIQGSVASGAVIMCWIDGIAELGYDNGHEYRRWPLSLSPTYFNTETAKYVYAAIPRSTSIGSQAVIVFPSEQLDINGKNASEQQIGSTDYLYIYLHGIISEVLTENDSTFRRWTLNPSDNWGQLDTAAARDAQKYTTDWYHYDQSTRLVSFLKGIAMSATSWFQNLRLGSSGNNLTGVAKSTTATTDSDTLVATPGYVQAYTQGKFLSKTDDDIAAGNITFEKNIAVGGNASISGNTSIGGNTDVAGTLEVVGDTTIDGILTAFVKMLTNRIESDNFTGDWQDAFGSGFQMKKNSADGVTSLVVDNLFVRMKAIFTELEIRKISYAGGNIIFSHAGSKVVRVEEVKENGVLTAYRCYLLKDDGSTATENWWRVGDQARCQTFNVVEPGNYTNTQNTYYWRLVVATGTEELEDGKNYDYVDLSATDYDTTTNNDIPQAGDQLVQMGNRGLDSDGIGRQGFVTIEVYGENAPAFKVYKGVSGYSLLNKRKVCLSPQHSDLKVQSLTIETEYDAQRVPMERGNWLDLSTDENGRRRCYYYDLLQHIGATWLCIVPEGTFTTDEPSVSSSAWRIYAQKGADAVPTAPNILLDTAEYKKPSLWWAIHGENSDGYMGRVARHVNPQGTSDPAGNAYQRIAEQQISGDGMTLLEPETWYTLSGFFKGSGLALIGLLQCGGYVEELYYADGEERTGTLTPTSDIYNAFSLTSEWTRHTLTFKTKATMSDTYGMYASTRLLDLTGNASVCMLKLEIGNKATAYLPNEQDMAGEDAMNVIVTPAALIVNQSLQNINNLSDLSSDPSARAILQIMSGGGVQQVTGISITSRHQCNATAGTASGNGYIQMMAVSTYTQGGKTIFYDSGYVICSLTYAGGTIDNVKVPFYANLLGTWKETVEGDTKAAIAQSNLFDLDPETWQIVESQYLGNFIQSSTQNIATLTAKVNNGKNMLKGVLTGAGWEDEDGNSVEVSDNEFLICSGDNITPPAFTLESGKQYTLSCDNNASVLFNNNEVTFSLSGSRHYAVLTAETTNTLEFRSDVKHPQLELGNVPTEFEADVTEISSRYKQTADNVRIGVTQGLSDTGIDISTGKVDVQANDFRVLDEDNTPLMSVSTSGGIRMIETEIEGSLQVNRTYADGVISTTTSIDAYSWGTGFYVHSSNTNTGYESMATFGSSNVAGRACSLNFSDSDGMSLYIDPTEVKLSEGTVIDVRIHSGGIDVDNGAVSLTGDGIDFDGAYMIMRKDGFEYPYADEWGGTGRNSLRGKRYTQIGTNMYLLIYGGLLIGYSTTKPDSSWTEINEIDPDQI